MFEALARADGISAHAAGFQAKWRTVAIYGADSNEVAEAHNHRARRGLGWQRLKWVCEVHRVATAHASTFESVESAIAGLIHIGLSLSTSASATVFRDVLRDTIRARIYLRGGALSAEAQSHKACVLKIFLSFGRNRNLSKDDANLFSKRGLARPTVRAIFSKTSRRHHPRPTHVGERYRVRVVRQPCTALAAITLERRGHRCVANRVA